MILQILRKLPVPALLFAAIAFSVSGSAPIGSEAMNDVLSLVDAWVLPPIKHPAAALFCAGLFAAWIIYQLVNLIFYEKKKRGRKQLAQLRDAGVAIRNECVTILPSNIPAWILRAEQWNTDATKAISKMDDADSMWFATLDAVPPARVPMTVLTATQGKTYREHDFRLVKLEQLMNKYARGEDN